MAKNAVERSKDDSFRGSAQFMFAAIGAAAGLGGIWRFPYSAYSSGGGKFLIHYWLAMLLVGIPMLSMEFCLGLLFQGNAYKSMKRVHNRLGGVGLATTFIAFVVTTYYTALLALIAVYFFRSMTAHLPWEPSTAEIATCNAFTESLTCKAQIGCAWVPDLAHNVNNMICDADALYIAKEFMNNSVLQENPTPGAEWPHKIVIWTFLTALLTYIAAYFSLFKGARITSYVSAFTVVCPGVMLIILVIQGVTLDGAGNGLKSFFGTWDLASLADGNIWASAISQNMFGLSVCQTLMIAYASHSARGTNVPMTTIATAIANHILEISSGIAVFSVAGFLALKSGYSVADLPLSSIKLVFIAYPVGMSSLPNVLRQIFAIAFFFTLWIIGISSAYSLLNGFSVLFEDAKISSKYSLPPKKTLLFATVISCVITIVYCTDTGMTIIDVVDFYVNRYIAMFTGFMECAGVGFFFLRGRQEMLIGKKSLNIFAGSYLGGCTIAAVIVFINKLINFRATESNSTGIIAFIVAVVIMVVGFIWAAIEAAKNGKTRAGLTAAQSIYLLVFGNIEEFREQMNDSCVGQVRSLKAIELNPSDVLTPSVKSLSLESGATESTVAPRFVKNPVKEAASRFNTTAMTHTNADSLPSWTRNVKFPFMWSILIKLVAPPLFTVLLTSSMSEFGTYGGYTLGMNFVGIVITAIGFGFVFVCAAYPAAFSWFDPTTNRTDTGMQNALYLHEALHLHAQDESAKTNATEIYTHIHHLYNPNEGPEPSLVDENEEREVAVTTSTQ